jgi:hypothetical protein
MVYGFENKNVDWGLEGDLLVTFTGYEKCKVRMFVRLSNYVTTK